MNLTLKDLIDHFDGDEAMLASLGSDPYILDQFLNLVRIVLPKLRPFIEKGIDVEQAALTGALGPFGAVLGLIAALAVKFGLDELQELALNKGIGSSESGT